MSKVIKNHNGFAHVGLVLLLVVVLGVAGGGGYYIWKKNHDQKQSDTTQSDKKTAKITNFDECVAAGNPVMESYPEQCSANGKTFVNESQRLSGNWLLFQSSDQNYSIRIPDGFIVLTSDKNLGFVLPDAPAGTLRYKKGVEAKIAGEPHKHFELGLRVDFGAKGWDDRGSQQEGLTTYSGLPVTVSLFEMTEEPQFEDFAKGTKHLKYTITQGDKFVNVDYAYLGEGHTNIIEEMVKTVVIK